MALVAKDPASSLNSADLLPFTTVDNGGARPLKAISALELALLNNGSLVYVESLRDYWKWVPTSTETDDSSGASAQLRYCNPTVNGANPGRFERLFLYSPDWLTQDFFIDTAGHNENPGTALLPIYNDLELRQRWGDNARLAQSRVVTWAQSPSTFTNLNVHVESGQTITYRGTPVDKRTGVTLTAVTTQNRATNTLWDITAAVFDATDVAHIVVITNSSVPANIGAYAFVLDRSGTTLTVSPFGKPNLGGLPAFTQVTPLANDVVSVITPTVLHPGLMTISGDFDRNNEASSYAVFDSLELGDQINNFGGGMISGYNLDIYYTRSILVYNLELSGFGGNIGYFNAHVLLGGGCYFGILVDAGCAVVFNQVGVKDAIIITRPGSTIALSTDTYMYASTILPFPASHVNTRGAAWQNQPFAFFTIVVEAGSAWTAFGAVAEWGTNNTGYGITIASTGKLTYETKPAVNSGLGAGREVDVGGTDKLYAAVPYIEGANDAAIVFYTF